MAVLGPSGGGDLGKLRWDMIFEGSHLPEPIWLTLILFYSHFFTLCFP